MSMHTVQRRTRRICCNFEKCVTGGNEQAVELIKAGAVLNEGFMAKVRAKNGPGRSVLSPAASSHFSLLGGGMERLL